MKFNITDIIPNRRNQSNTYIIHCKYQHGDDKERLTIGTHTIGGADTPTLDTTMQFLMKFINVDMGNPRQISKIAEKIATELKLNHTGEDMLRKYFVADAQYVGMLAVITEVWVTYFNEHGHEHFVTISQ